MKKVLSAILPAVVLSLTIGAAAAEPGPMSFGIWHVRFAAPAAKTARAAIVWDDSMRMEVEVPPRGADDSLAPMGVRYRLSRSGDTVADGVFYDSYPLESQGMSLVLRTSAHGTVAEAGASAAGICIEVPFSGYVDGGLRVDNPAGLRIQRNTINSIHRPEPQFIDPDSIPQSPELPASPQGRWQYLDRDTNPSLAVPGGRYRLAITACGDSLYNIVYLGGADYGDWTPGMVKGRLRPTGFAGNFDLEWLDSTGSVASSENYADLDSSSGILSLRFPLLESTLRFRRTR